MTKPRMSFKDACDLVPDDMPDGAYWALAHEIAGLEYGDGFDELIGDTEAVDEDHQKRERNALAKARRQAKHKGGVYRPRFAKPWLCQCGKAFRSQQAQHQHAKDVRHRAIPDPHQSAK